MGAEGALNMGRRRHPNFFFLLPSPKAAANGRLGHPKRGAEGATPPEGERNLLFIYYLLNLNLLIKHKQIY